MALEAVHVALGVIKIIHEAFGFSAECRELAARCRAIQTILDNNESSFHDVAAISELSDRLVKCRKYLESCKERWFVRNPIFEVTFHKRIEQYKTRLDSWIITATLSLTVLSSLKMWTNCTRELLQLP